MHNPHTSQIRGNFCAAASSHRRDATRRLAILRIQAARCIRGTLVFAVSIRISRRDVFRGTRPQRIRASPSALYVDRRDNNMPSPSSPLSRNRFRRNRLRLVEHAHSVKYYPIVSDA